MGIAAAIIAGGAIAAGGAVGGSALAASGAKGARDATFQTSDASPFSDPLTALSALQEQIRMGVVDPSYLQQSSPIQQAIAVALQQPMTQRDRDHLLGEAQQLRMALSQGGDTNAILDNWYRRGNLENLSRWIGVTPQQLIQQESAFQARLGPLIAQAQSAASGTFEQRLAMQRQLASLGESVVGTNRIPELEASFKQSLTHDINKQADEARLDLLRTGNFGNFNPGRAVGDVEESRFQSLRNVDTDALVRAVQVLTSANAATGSQANVLQGLLGQANPNLLAAAQQFSAPTIAGVQADNAGAMLGAGVAQGAGTFGTALSLGALAGQGGKPAAADTRYKPSAGLMSGLGY